MSEHPRWTHPSVLNLQKESGGRDPMLEISRRAEQVALAAMEHGWSGPPYDPFQLADHLGIEIVAREDIDDARLVAAEDGPPRIEFNPHRRPERVRFSMAHEIGHSLFPDHGEQVRYRNRSHGHDVRPDDWQLEVLCNVAAAELLMPAGAFPATHLQQLSLTHLLDLRAHFGVSTEALLRRVVKLADEPVCLFAAARCEGSPGFRLDYWVPSRAWRTSPPDSAAIPPDSVLARCTAVGYSDTSDERWADQDLHVQAVGVPPYPGDRLPRIVGLVQPAHAVTEAKASGFRYVRGDATEPHAEGPAIIAHVVNDRARRWNPRGFAGDLMRRYPNAVKCYERWSVESGERSLGAVHLGEVKSQLWVASLVSQAGYGDQTPGRPRLRVAALRQALEALAGMARERGASVQMPLIGTGQAGGSWPVVRDLVLGELVDRGVEVTVYVLPEQLMPGERVEQDQLTLA